MFVWLWHTEAAAAAKYNEFTFSQLPPNGCTLYKGRWIFHCCWGVKSINELIGHAQEKKGAYCTHSFRTGRSLQLTRGSPHKLTSCHSDPKNLLAHAGDVFAPCLPKGAMVRASESRQNETFEKKIQPHLQNWRKLATPQGASMCNLEGLWKSSLSCPW